MPGVLLQPFAHFFTQLDNKKSQYNIQYHRRGCYASHLLIQRQQVQREVVYISPIRIPKRNNYNMISIQLYTKVFIQFSAVPSKCGIKNQLFYHSFTPSDAIHTQISQLLWLSLYKTKISYFTAVQQALL